MRPLYPGRAFSVLKADVALDLLQRINDIVQADCVLFKNKFGSSWHAADVWCYRAHEMKVAKRHYDVADVWCFGIRIMNLILWSMG